MLSPYYVVERHFCEKVVAAMAYNVYKNTAVLLRTPKRCDDRRYKRPIPLRRAAQTNS
jgi:hypothetical protein